MEDLFITLTKALLQEWNLIAYTKFQILTDLEMSLGRSLEVEVIGETELHTKTDIMESLL